VSSLGCFGSRLANTVSLGCADVRPAPSFEERPYNRSRRLYDGPPVGTIALGDERAIYLGSGDWQPLDDAPPALDWQGERRIAASGTLGTGRRTHGRFPELTPGLLDVDPAVHVELHEVRPEVAQNQVPPRLRELHRDSRSRRRRCPVSRTVRIVDERTG